MNRSIGLLAWFFIVALASLAHTKDAVLPNIVWITSEDNGPHLGCYGDSYATSPNLDRLASRGLIYLNAWSNAPVCAPARTTIITGVYPPALGAEHMRSMVPLPPFMKMYPQFLREAGYYCTNNSKEDYNAKKPPEVWNDSSPQAHWKNRQPGQPFFAVFNHAASHESQIRKRPHMPVHDPARVRVPAYHPDTPEVRRDWAQYYDKITEMDALVGKNLQELAEAGLANDTIVFYYGDHGSGMPRSKRWPYNSGLSVPLIVYVPPRFSHLAPPEYKAGGKADRLVSFVDLAPTLLSIVGIEAPDWMQGHAFMGRKAAEPQSYNFGFRGRMDERYDMARSMRDKRYVYIRNYMPHLIYGQHVDYMFQTPTTQVWKRLFDEGQLNAEQSIFWQSKPPEELYDLVGDPDEVQNLAVNPDYADMLQRFRRAHDAWVLGVRDIGFLPESEIHRRSQGSTAYELGHDLRRYPLERIMAAAQLASSLDPEVLPKLHTLLRDQDSAVRYWGAMGLLMHGQTAIGASSEQLNIVLHDESPAVRVVAAQALAQFGSETVRKTALSVLLKAASVDNESVYVAIQALNALELVDNRPAHVDEAIARLPTTRSGIEGRMNEYVPRLIQTLSTESAGDRPSAQPKKLEQKHGTAR